MVRQQLQERQKTGTTDDKGRIVGDFIRQQTFFIMTINCQKMMFSKNIVSGSEIFFVRRVGGQFIFSWEPAL